VAEGNVGGGTGMICYQFKGGTGTSSRKLAEEEGGWTVGVLVQANFGRRPQLQVAGVPVGKLITEHMPAVSSEDAFAREQGSIIIVVATNAPLLPHQLKRLARRATMGLARTGSMAGNSSGDLFVAFSTANPGSSQAKEQVTRVEFVSNDHIDPLFYAAANATEEAIINALVAAKTMRGRDGFTAHALPHKHLREVLRDHKRLVE
jgi:D-aminopeptidase